MAAHLGHQPKPGIEILAFAFICRSAFATRLHDFSERTLVACRSRTGLARARHFHAAWLKGIRTPANPSTQPIRLASRGAQSQNSVGAHSRPAAEHTRLSKTSRANIEWLLQCFQADLACPLQSKPILACKAAADACAEGTKVGIGGWFISSPSVSWFAETWDFQEVQQQWPCLTKEDCLVGDMRVRHHYVSKQVDPFWYDLKGAK